MVHATSTTHSKGPTKEMQVTVTTQCVQRYLETCNHVISYDCDCVYDTFVLTKYLAMLASSPHALCVFKHKSWLACLVKFSSACLVCVSSFTI